MQAEDRIHRLVDILTYDKNCGSLEVSSQHSKGLSHSIMGTDYLQLYYILLSCRLGQKSASVRIIYLVARGSVDQIVWDQIQRKHNVLRSTVGMRYSMIPV